MTDTDTPEPSAPAAPPRPSWETAPRPAPRPVPRAPPPRAPLAAAAPRLAPPPAPLRPAAPAPEAGVRYDLAGNPIADSGPRPSAYAPPPSYGQSGGPASSAVWPPAPTGGAMTYRNNSGEQSDVPPEIAGKRWHWGAFFFPILWLRRHNMTAQAGLISAALIVPRVLHSYAPAPFGGLLVAAGLLAYWAVRIYFGWSGHKFAWRNRHFPDGVSQYFKVQQAWMLWGFGIFALDIGLQIFVLGALLTAAHSVPSGGTYRPHTYRTGGYSSSYSRPYSSAAPQ